MYTKLVGSLITVIFAFSLSSTTLAQDYPEMKLRLAHFLTPNFPGSQVDKWFADEVKARSNGKIKIEIFYAGSLGKATELLDLVSSGAVRRSSRPRGPYRGQEPHAQVAKPQVE